jgi:hypothetical protein
VASGSSFSAILLTLSLGAACQPNLDIGAWTCSVDGSVSKIPEETAPVTVPWSTGFENRFCDYTELAGFCYALDAATYELVTSPVHSGRYAAAFKVSTDGTVESQARCVRQGVLPTAAYYGAWYYIAESAVPTPIATGENNWNLFHFRGGLSLFPARGVLDVSLVDVDGALQLGVFGMNHRPLGEAVLTPVVPIGAWFHVQLYLQRGEGTAGEIALYLNGQQVFELTDMSTDDSSLGQWFVGNLATDLTPSDVTLYVDDVTIKSTL